MTKKAFKKSQPKSGYFVAISFPGAHEAAIKYLDKGEFQLAANMLEVLVELEPEKMDPKYHLGFCYWELERHSEAIIQLEIVVKERPKIALGWETLARVYYAAGHTLLALSHMARAVVLDPDKSFARLMYAVFLRRSGDDVAAIEQLREASSKPPDDGQALYLLANTLERLPFAKGRSEAALHYSTVAKRWPGTQWGAWAALDLLELSRAEHAEQV